MSNTTESLNDARDFDSSSKIAPEQSLGLNIILNGVELAKQELNPSKGEDLAIIIRLALRGKPKEYFCDLLEYLDTFETKDAATKEIVAFIRGHIIQVGMERRYLTF